MEEGLKQSAKLHLSIQLPDAQPYMPICRQWGDGGHDVVLMHNSVLPTDQQPVEVHIPLVAGEGLRQRESLKSAFQGQVS